MTSKIFKSILSVATAVLLASLVIITGVLYRYFGDVQESQLKDELSLAASAAEQLGEDYLAGLDYDRYRLTWVDADGNVVTSGRVEFYNCKNNLVSANNKLVILQDLEGYLVNDTEDVLVICKKDEDDDFKKFRNSVLLKHGESYM